MGEQAEKPPEEKKPEEEEAAKGDEKKTAEESKDAPPPPPPPPPQEIVLRVFMHCEGCARKVRRCLRGFDGVEDIQTDCKSHKVIVKGEKADPIKVLERVQKKSHRKVDLLSPMPKPPAEEPKVEEKEPPKPEEKKEEPPQVIIVILKVNMHCEACAQVIRKRIMRMKGVESVEPDLKNSQVSVKGTFTAAELVDYVHRRTGKHAVVVKQDPEPKKEEEKKDGGETKEKEEEKKPAGDGGDGAGAVAGAGDDSAGGEGKEKEKNKEKDTEEKKSGDGEGGGGGGGGGGGEEAGDGGPAGGGEGMTVMELRKNEVYYYHPGNYHYQYYPARYMAAEAAYGYPPAAPQMFSDENPNACSVM